jgi:asparagine N-glycosylation enzyme membrane subunit Stt3
MITAARIPEAIIKMRESVFFFICAGASIAITIGKWQGTVGKIGRS